MNENFELEGYQQLKHKFNATLMFFFLLLVGIAINFFVVKSVIVFVVIYCLLVMNLTQIVNISGKASQFDLLAGYQYLIADLDENGKKHTVYLADDQHLNELYRRVHNIRNDHDIENKYKQLMSKYVIAKKALDGYQRSDHIGGNPVYYLMEVDGNFYYDDEKNALLAFSSKQTAQTYINEQLPTFKGYLQPFRVAYDGFIKGDAE